jgi:hypothetical protein
MATNTQQQSIYEPDDTFDFSNFKLAKPVQINQSSGSFLIKFRNGISTTNTLLIQSPKCITKKGIVNGGKKNTAELVFSGEDDEQFINWVEVLESNCRTAIFQRRAEFFGKEWADNINDITDLDTYFRNIMRPFKGARNYSISVNIPPDLTIYDENENEIDATKIIGEQTRILCILEFEGIKCNLSNFEYQIKVRQMMTLEPIFAKCLIKKSGNVGSGSATTIKQDLGNIVTPNEETLKGDATIQTPPFNDSSLGLVEAEINFEETEGDIIKLKDRRQIYLELYRNAKEKARIARNIALSAYLEKMRIKNAYMLDDVESDDDDDDDELFD